MNFTIGKLSKLIICFLKTVESPTILILMFGELENSKFTNQLKYKSLRALLLFIILLD